MVRATKHNIDISFHKEFRRALKIALRNSYTRAVAHNLHIFEDFLLVPLLHMYIEDKTDTTFTQFVKHYNFATLHPHIRRPIESAIHAILTHTPHFLSQGIIIGDFHGVRHSKWKVRNTIIAPRLKWEKEFQNFAKKCGLAKLFPKYQILSADWILRVFLPAYDSRLSDDLLQSYYFDLGQTLAMSSAMQIVDLHCENIARIGKTPYFFDLECAFTPRFTDADFSIKASGIIADPDEEGTKFDHSVLSGRLINNQSLLKPILVNPKQPSILWTATSRSSPCHIPKNSDGERVAYQNYSHNILNGYTAATIKISDNALFLPGFNLETKCRILIRPSSIYKAIQQEYFFPISYERYSTKDFFARKLKKQKMLFRFRTGEMVKIINEEILMLEDLEIPLFYLHPRTGVVESANGTIVARLPRESLFNPKHLRNGFKRDKKILVEFFSTHRS